MSRRAYIKRAKILRCMLGAIANQRIAGTVNGDKPLIGWYSECYPYEARRWRRFERLVHQHHAGRQ